MRESFRRAADHNVTILPAALASISPLGEKLSACVGVAPGFHRLSSLPDAPSHSATLASWPEVAKALPCGRQAMLSVPNKCSPIVSTASESPSARASATLPSPPAIANDLPSGDHDAIGDVVVEARGRARLQRKRQGLLRHGYFATADSKPASSSARSSPRPMNTRLFMRGVEPHGRSAARRTSCARHGTPGGGLRPSRSAHPSCGRCPARGS